jgi:hypothetical protein
MTRLIDHRHVGHSQSGEEGIVSRIFDVLEFRDGLCCEFGAWDGIYLSNTRALMERGWRGLMIEPDLARYEQLCGTYPSGSRAACVRSFVDVGENSLARIAARSGILERFSFVSIDIDGLDYEVFSSLAEFSQPPMVVCVEAHTCHRPDDLNPVPAKIASKGAGQPIGRYVEVGVSMGYRLVCFIGTNAFFMHRDAGHEGAIPTLTPIQAALQNLEFVRENKLATEYLYLCNLGKVQPFYEFRNPLFSSRSLGIDPLRAVLLRFVPADESGKLQWRWIKSFADRLLRPVTRKP